MADPKGTPQPTSVYRYYDEFDLLLYVGVTSRGAVRNAEHYSTKTWWQHVVRQEVEHLPSRDAALRLERDLIAEFRPPFNTQHNPGSGATRAAYEQMRSAGLTPKGVAETSEHLGRNRIEMAVQSAGDCTYLSYAGPLMDFLDFTDPFPVSGARLMSSTVAKGRLVVTVRPKREASVISATLMYGHRQHERLGVKRLDVITGGAN